MALDFHQLMTLWSQPLPDGEAAIERFAAFYTDPVSINGTAIPLASLVERARATQRAFADLQATVLAQIDTDTHTIVVFKMRGRHVGPLPTPLGEVAPTGKVSERQIIDVLGLRGGRVAEVWMVGDELSALVQLGALRLA